MKKGKQFKPQYTMTSLTLQFGISFQDLHRSEGLRRLDRYFDNFVEKNDVDLFQRYKKARDLKEENSEIILDVAPILEDFLSELFGIESEVQTLQKKHRDLAPLYTCKRTFIQRQVAKKRAGEGANTLDGSALRAKLETYFDVPYDDLTYATHVLKWLQNPEGFTAQLQTAKDYGTWAVFAKAGQLYHKDFPLFQLPQKQNFDALIPVDYDTHQRHGFSLTDPGFSRAQAVDQASYCLYCHDRDKDSCAKGLPSKSTPGVPGKNPLGRTLEGCPLGEKISEMTKLKADGLSIAALSVVTIDNPLVAATGHRICNDCMASCIFQKQDPVNVPGVETQNLKEVLALPWGFEIYSLLTRWNPLRFDSPTPKDPTGGRALVVGMGPAGFTLAHYLLQEGHSVVGVDGLKIEPLPQDLLATPIRDSSVLFEGLDDRIVGGFGGVAEYGITVRWDKNFLKIIRLLLERRSEFLLQGGVRFGSTITPDQAFQEFGFDHVALCSGAGQPNLVPMKNALARGVRQASDFLMALQLTGAGKKTSLANLELRLPAIVIGGGLTAIDTATEALAYYPLQVEKFLNRYEELGENFFEQDLGEEQKKSAQRWLEHARILRKEHQKSEPDILKHLQSWGGVSVLYRKTLQDSPGYRLNHEEVFKALQEGIHFIGEGIPKEVILDEFDHAKSLRIDLRGDEKIISAASIFVAAGTKPNVTLSKEYPDIFELDGVHYKSYGVENVFITPPKAPHSLSHFGDLHPTYKGNVVKAMASAKYGFGAVCQALTKRNAPQKAFLKTVKEALSATVHKVNRLTPTVTEIIIHAPQAVKNFRPGQFYRLQNFESLAPQILGTTLAMEGLALTGAWVNLERNLISLIVLEMGGSSQLCQLLKPGEPVVLMGPTGEATEIPTGETICLMGGGLGNAVLFSIGKAMKEAGNHVVYLAGYKKASDVFYADKIKEAANQVIWLNDEGSMEICGPWETAMKGTILKGLQTLDLSTFDRFLAIGSHGMMGAVKSYLMTQNLKDTAKLVVSVNAPMQCMMKEICAQCLQRHVDPTTGIETYIYTCATQDQNMKSIDFAHLKQRLKQNETQEKMTALWIEKCRHALKNKAY